MAKYMIHTFPDRLWYVEEFLIPSMLSQGIDINDITVWNDKYRDGNLESCMKAFASLDEKGGTWHLQDDVVISRDFKKVTEANDKGIVCGFCNEHFDQENVNLVGVIPINSAWFSFPCIRIPNKYAKECADWYYKEVLPQNLCEDLRENGRNDDAMWRRFINDRHPKESCYNLIFNIVDHIDYLIGGSSVNPQREGIKRGYRFADKDVVEDLERKLSRRKKRDSSEPRQKRTRKFR